MAKYTFSPDMNEISGFGGAYEDCCRRMLVAAVGWLDDHPGAEPQFGRFGQEENADAKAMSAAALKAAGEYGPSGNQHGIAIAHALWIKANGWDAYVKEKTHPQGELGIVKEKLARAEKDVEMWRNRFEEVTEENHKRGEIIAANVLGWRKYKVSNGQQEAYAPSQEAALNDLYAGCSLHKLVDEAIKGLAT